MITHAGFGKPVVFLAQSFDETAPAWSTVADARVVEWFKNLMEELGWTVLSGEKCEPRPILEKVFDYLDKSMATVAIFTGKRDISPRQKDPGGRLVPSPWVLCECACAKGRFREYPYVVAGFREKGIDPADLAMVTVGGMEIPEFDRENLRQSKRAFKNYLRLLEDRISNPGDTVAHLYPYSQAYLYKRYIVYRNGYCAVQNINTLVIHDPDAFFGEQHRGRVRHHIWNQRAQFPDLTEMMHESIHMRKEKPFFYARLDYHGTKKLDIPLKVTPELGKHTGTDIGFLVEFCDQNGSRLRLKRHDILRYQYAWGLPNMYAVYKEDLPEVTGDQIDPRQHCVADAMASRGPIERLALEIRFEREAKGMLNRQLFSYGPSYQVGAGHGSDPVWTLPQPMPHATGEPAEFDFWYEIYRLDRQRFNERLRIVWRPSGKMQQL